MLKLRRWVFFPPFFVLLGATIYSLVNVESFLQQVTLLNNWILDKFGWLYALGTLFFLLICVWVYFSPIAKIRIGGTEANPILTRWRWFAITLTTTVAIGILFWGTAEPLYHLHQPPANMDIEENSLEAAQFSMSTMFMHWTFTPYAIYTLAGLMFALTYYNLKQPFSLGSLLYPLLGKRAHGRIGKATDAICLYSLVAGMAASLGAGILTISSGMETMMGIKGSALSLGLITLAIVASFIVSAASGLLKGIRILSNINVIVFIGIAIFVAIFGPTLFMLKLGLQGFWEYCSNFIPRSAYTLGINDSSWLNSWTIFYWANWLAWTPVTALFLGRLAYGYTVRDYIHFNLLLPALFGMLWMTIFSGASMQMDINNNASPMYDVLQKQGAEYVIYAVFQQLPIPKIMSVIFLITSFLSYVTAADSNTSAMSGISATGISPESPEPSFWIKLVWGTIVGTIAWVMVAFAGIDGIKMTSNLGGLPALFLIIAVGIGMIRMIHKKMLSTEKSV